MTRAAGIIFMILIGGPALGIGALLFLSAPLVVLGKIWPVLAIIAAVVVGALVVGMIEGEEYARKVLAEAKAVEDAQDAVALHVAMLPDYRPGATVVPRGTVLHRRRTATPPIERADDPLPRGGPHARTLRA